MKTQVLKGSKQQIAEAVARIRAEVREVVVFLEEPSDLVLGLSEEDIFAEMEPLMVNVGNVDYSRAAFYTRKEEE